jgi:serine/threonine protein kinase
VEGSQTALEEFKIAFGGSSRSTSYDWAVSDFGGLATARASNAALFVDSVWKCVEAAQARNLQVPSARTINKILHDHAVPLVLEPPHLRLATEGTMVISAPEAGLSPGPVPMFVLGAEIGKGGYGVVYRATRSTAVGEFEYALKVLDPSPFIADYDKAIKRFRREVKTLRLLQHRSIVSYFEAGLTVDGKPYVVMPLIQGLDLRSAAGQAAAGVAVNMFAEVLYGLAYAHQNNVIHRDLKPSNIIVRSSDRQPVILDFGAAYVLDEVDTKTLTTHVVGTIGYIPSEVLADPSLRSPLQDIYACGVMLYEALAGKRPDPANYVPMSIVRPKYQVLDPIVQQAIAGANVRMTSAQEFADRLSALHLDEAE